MQTVQLNCFDFRAGADLEVSNDTASGVSDAWFTDSSEVEVGRVATGVTESSPLDAAFPVTLLERDELFCDKLKKLNRNLYSISCEIKNLS